MAIAKYSTAGGSSSSLTLQVGGIGTTAFVHVGVNSGGTDVSPAPTVTDNKGNTWTLIASKYGGIAVFWQAVYWTNALGSLPGGTNITISTSQGAIYSGFCISGAGAIDAFNNTGNTLSPSGNNELFIAWCNAGSNSYPCYSIAANSGFSLISSGAIGAYMFGSEYQIQTTASSVYPQFTFNGGGGNGYISVLMKPAASYPTWNGVSVSAWDGVAISSWDGV